MMKKTGTIGRRMIMMLLVLVILVCGSVSSASAAKTVALNKKTISIAQFATYQLKLKNARKKVTWKSSNSKVAKISKKGLVTGVRGGKCTITATSAGDSYTCNVTVKAVALSKTQQHVRVGKTYQLKLNNSSKKVSKITWKTSNKKIATVSTSGKVKGINKGVCTITATYKKKKFQCKLTVDEPGEIELNETELELLRAKTVQLKLAHIGGKAKWTSSEPSVATVSADGLVKAISIGQTVITAEYNGVNHYCFVSVRYPFSKATDKIVLAGSSTIDFWKGYGDKTAFAPYQIVNVGLSSSKATQWLAWEDSKIVANHPKAVVIYVGANDIGAGGNGLGQQTANTVIQLLTDLKNKLPGVPIYYVSVVKNYARKNAWPNVVACNKAVSAFCKATVDVYFIDINPSLSKPDGTPNEALFGSDQLHHNQAGYAVWEDVVAGRVKRELMSK